MVGIDTPFWNCCCLSMCRIVGLSIVCSDSLGHFFLLSASRNDALVNKKHLGFSVIEIGSSANHLCSSVAAIAWNDSWVNKNHLCLPVIAIDWNDFWVNKNHLCLSVIVIVWANKNHLCFSVSAIAWNAPWVNKNHPCFSVSAIAGNDPRVTMNHLRLLTVIV